MSQQKPGARKKSIAAAGKKPALKKLPAKTAAAKSKSASQQVVVDWGNRPKKFSSIITLLKRRFGKGADVPMPTHLKPMLATLVNQPFNDKDWLFEIKLDGYRALAYLQNGQVSLASRNNNSFNKKFETVYQALTSWQVNAVVDGELVVLDEEGHADFNGIQQWEKKGEGQLLYYVYDLLWLEGMNLMDHPLVERKEILRQIIPDSSVIRYSDHIEECGTDFFEIARQNKLEGIMAKNKNAVYVPGMRSKAWLKIKTEERHEAVICGYTKKADSDRLFSSLVLGVYEGKTLKFIGQVGTGFNASLQKELHALMMPLEIKKAPFKKAPDTGAPTVWLKPKLVCEVRYQELTKEGVMRHASFQGLREDKDVADLNTEKEIETKEVVAVDNTDLQTALIQKDEENKIITLDGKDLKLTNLKKIYWPKEKYTKGDLLNYYHQVAPYMMPYMLNRPQSLNRFPNGITGESFYQKNMTGKVDKWIKTFNRFSDSTGDAKDFMICTNEASLIYMANLGCIEMNPWHSRVQSPHYPDWCVIDLDPGDIAFEKVIETAVVVKNILDHLGVASFPKTSGSTGIHIYVPLGAKYNYDQSKQFAELVAHMAHEELPLITSLERSPAKRTDKIYLDYLQNRPIQTICAPYSVRPKPGATVSTPLHWSEVKKGLQIANFNMKNIFERLAVEGDLFGGVLQNGMDLNKALKALSSLI